MNNIKVSVLTYVLNDATHVEKCVRSVMSQTLEEIEILLIDGGSTDGTLAILEKLAKEDSRIRLIHSEPGVGKQFNTGLRMASGKYIGICESDDYILPDMYKRQYEIAEQYQLDVLRADYVRFFEKDGKTYFFPLSVVAQPSTYDTLLCSQANRNFMELGVNGFWTGVYSREFLLRNHLFMNETEGAAYQDTAFSFLTEMYAERAYVMKHAFYFYRMDNPKSSVNSPKKITLISEEYRLLKQQLKQRGLWEAGKELYWKFCLGSHFWFYDIISTVLRSEYISFLYESLRRDIDTEKFQGTELDKRTHELHAAVLQSYDEFMKFWKAYDNAFKEELQSIRAIEPHCDIVIFGTGNLGELVNSCLGMNDRNASASIDNDKMKWNTEWNGMMVLSPQECIKRYPNAVYLVASVAFFQEMKDQLIQSGIQEENILIFSHYDILLKQLQNNYLE